MTGKIRSSETGSPTFLIFVFSSPEFVRLGDQNLASNKDKLEPVDYEIKNIIIHDDYHYFQKINDIALFELESKVIFTKYIRPACLSQAMNFQGKVIAVSFL